MKNILVFTGAGIDKESGVDTFRDSKDGLWNNFKVEDVATLDGWHRDKEKVLGFYNNYRTKLKDIKPNLAHKIIAELEKDFNVTVVTQNVTNLHEVSGSRKVIHLHGELYKSQSTLDSSLTYECKDDIKIGDKCERGSQLRPYVTWFGEDLDSDKLLQAERAAKDCDICIIIGTSMQVAPANMIPFMCRETALIYYVDPSDRDFNLPRLREHFFYHIQEQATTGIKKVYDELITL
jgi:NAD-dependent deacetylase